MLKSTGTVGLALWLATASALAGDTPCPELDGAAPDMLLDYLQREKRSLKPVCVDRAMLQISLITDPRKLARFDEAIKTLIGLIDYRLPVEAMYGGALSNHSPYPAAWALAAIGKPVATDMVSAIASASTSPIGQDLGAWVMFSIYSRDDPAEAIRVLKRARNVAVDSRASLRLWDAARKAAKKWKGRLWRRRAGRRCTRQKFRNRPD